MLKIIGAVVWNVCQRWQVGPYLHFWIQSIFVLCNICKIRINAGRFKRIFIVVVYVLMRNHGGNARSINATCFQHKILLRVVNKWKSLILLQFVINKVCLCTTISLWWKLYTRLYHETLSSWGKVIATAIDFYGFKNPAIMSINDLGNDNNST